jgi:hypothetical protein
MDAAQMQLVPLNVLARMPLAEAAHWLLRWACDPVRLDAVWGLGCGRSYERALSFATLTRLIAEALLHHGGSGRRAFEKNILAQRLNVSVAAAFGKLGRLPLAVSQAFLEETTASLAEVVVPAAISQPQPSLRGLYLIIVDGKTIKRVQKRLKPLRGVRGGLIGGKALVALDGRTGLAMALEANPDGDGSETRLVPGLLERVRRRCPGPRLFVADRAFGNLVQAEQFSTTGDHFLTRLHSSCKFSPDLTKPAVISYDEAGRKHSDTWGVLGGSWNKRRRVVRRIELQRGPTEEPIVVVTDLEDAVTYPAIELMSTYRGRHGIETVFQKTTEVFGLKRLIGGSPQAGLFQFAFCLLLYNIVQTLLGHVAEANAVAPERVSAEKMFDEVQKQIVAWHVVFTPEQTEAYYQRLPDWATFMGHLRQILTGIWCPTWTKAKPQPHRRVPHKAPSRSHSSVYRLLEEAPKEKRPPPKRPGSEPQSC